MSTAEIAAIPLAVMAFGLLAAHIMDIVRRNDPPASPV